MPADPPLHPATVHFPLAFLLSSTFLSAHTYLRPYFPSPPPNLTTFLSTTSSVSLNRASYHLLGLGLLTVLPATLTGGQQLWLMVQKNGLYEGKGEQKAIRGKVATTLWHAVGQDVAMALFGARWWMQWRAGLEGGDADGLGVLLTVLATGVMLWSAKMGGMLTYVMGVGLSAGGGGRKKER